MKRTAIYCLLLLLTIISGCSKDDEDDDLTGDWSRKSDYEGIPRNAAFVFTIDNKAYVGTGYDGENRLSDVWAYDSDKNTWIAIADFPGKARSNAVAFTINGKGYVGTGYDGDVALKDFWEYTPSTNKWREVASLPTTQGRYDAVAFSVNNQGYVGTGKDNDKKDQQDFYRYDATADAWTKVSSLGIKRSGAFSFVIGTKAYVGGGTNNGSYTQEFYVYDITNDSWSEKQDLNQSDNEDNDYDYVINRSNAMTFVITGQAYVTCGNSGSSLNTTWRYDESSDSWTEVDYFEGSARQYGVGFSLKNIGYASTGNNGTLRYDDTWAFDPNAANDN